jgi:hypothetical protein
MPGLRVTLWLISLRGLRVILAKCRFGTLRGFRRRIIGDGVACPLPEWDGAGLERGAGKVNDDSDCYGDSESACSPITARRGHCALDRTASGRENYPRVSEIRLEGFESRGKFAGTVSVILGGRDGDAESSSLLEAGADRSGAVVWAGISGNLAPSTERAILSG